MTSIRTYIYKLFGLTVASELALLETDELERNVDHFDVSIQYGTDTSLERFDQRGYYIENGDFNFYVPEAAIFHITSGSKIIVTPLPDAEQSKIRLYLLGTCMGVLLMQRGIVPLHGSAIAIDGKAYAIVGESGAGKSTLAAAFIENGLSLLTDDVIAVRFNDSNGQPMVHPSYPQQKLWQESLDHFGREATGYDSIFQRVDKYAVPIRSSFHYEPLPLAGVIELSKSPQQAPSLQAYSQLEGLHMLNIHTYRIHFIHKLGLQQWHFKQITRLAAELPVYQLKRPKEGAFTAYELVRLVLQQIRQEEAIVHER